MVNRRLSLSSYVVFGLAAIGILSGLFRNPGSYLIPVVVLGGIFLLYKYLPNQARQTRTARYAAPAKRKSRTSPFRVIPGSKSSDDTPKYH